MSNQITIITKETITMVTQIIIIMITITTTNSMITTNKKGMILIDLTTKIMIKGITNKDQIGKKKIRNRIDKTGIKTHNQIIKNKKNY